MKAVKKNFIDISVTIKSGMVHWPGDPSVKITRIKDMRKGDSNNASRMNMGSHTGTHMDAPFHFLRNGKGLDQMPLGATIGKARVIKIHDRESIKPAELKKHRMKRGERILFKTVNSERCWASGRFVKDFVYISKEAAGFLAKKGIQTVGVDYLSVGGFYKDGQETHHILLKSGIWIIEGLNLSQVREGSYNLICLPLKILKSDGAPARAVLQGVHKG